MSWWSTINWIRHQSKNLLVVLDQKEKITWLDSWRPPLMTWSRGDASLFSRIQQMWEQRFYNLQAVSLTSSQNGKAIAMGEGCLKVAALQLPLSLCLLSHLLTHPGAAGNFQIGPLCLPLMKVVAAADERGNPKKTPKGGWQESRWKLPGFWWDQPKVIWDCAATDKLAAMREDYPRIHVLPWPGAFVLPCPDFSSRCKVLTLGSDWFTLRLNLFGKHDTRSNRVYCSVEFIE